MLIGTIIETSYEFGNLRRVEFDCTAGSADALFPAHVITAKIDGTVLELETIPGTTPAPSIYAITLTDAFGVDVLQGLGTARSATVKERIPIVYATNLKRPIVDTHDTLTLNVTGNNVNSATTKVILRYALGAIG